MYATCFRRGDEGGTTSLSDLLTTEPRNFNSRDRSQTALIFEKTLQLPPRLPGLPPVSLKEGSILKQPEASIGGTATFATKPNGQSSVKNSEKPQSVMKK